MNIISLSFWLVPLFLLIWFQGFSQETKITLNIGDSVHLSLKKGRAQVVELSIKIRNNSEKVVHLNRQYGIVELGSIVGEYDSNFCNNVHGPEFKKFVLKGDGKTLFDADTLGVSELVYFSKSGRLKYDSYGGLKDSGRNKRVLRKMNNKFFSPAKISILPNKEVNYKAKVYLGNYKMAPNSAYYLILVYKSEGNIGLSDICLESNRLKMKT